MLTSASLWVDVLVFVAGALVIAWTGTRLAALADQLADRTGLGEAVTGTVFLGLTTALPGLAASLFAVVEARPALALSNAVGGIALQTAFLAVADLVYRRANLEHAAASAVNMIQTVVLVTLLTIVLLGLSGPDVTLGPVHPATLCLMATAAVGFVLVYRSSREPMWHPEQTPQTVEDVADDAQATTSLRGLVLRFAAAAVVVTLAGAAVAHATGNIADRTGMSQTVAGGLLSGVATSLPELVTTIAAVRRGALTLAVGDIVGGNFFDVLFIAAADFAHVDGSLFHAAGIGAREQFLTALAALLNLVLLLGLLYRQRAGPARIGFESVLLLLLYPAGFLILSLAM